MNYKKYIKRGLFVATAVVGLSSCSEDLMDDINRNPNNPLDVQAKFVLTDAITRTAVNNVGGDLNTYLSTYVEHFTGVHNQLFFSENRVTQPQASSTFNNSWGSLYTALRDAKVVVDKCSPGGSQEGNDVTLGMGQVLMAYNIALLTDMFGDVPYTEALQTMQIKTPVIDKQEDLYVEVLSLLDQAIENLAKTDSHVSGTAGAYDLLYGGNKDAWRRLAFGLRARYTLHKINRSTNAAADYASILSDVSNSFTSAAQQADFNVYNVQNLNPLYDFQWSRVALGGSRSMADKLIERNDPRLRRVFMTAGWANLQTITPGDTAYNLLPPNGQVVDQAQEFYTDSPLLYAQTASTLLMSYHELMFIRAEVLQRSGASAAEVQTALRLAVQAGVANAEKSYVAAYSAPGPGQFGGLTERTDPVTADEMDEYFDETILPLFAANPLSEIANQKYLAFLGSSGETTEIYNDIRRWKANGEEFIVLKNPGRFPVRLPYGNSETTTNPNVQAAYGDGTYVYSENVWWAGGSR